MAQILSIITIILIWIISFVEPSGWAITLHLPEKINLIILIISIYFFLKYPYRRQNIPSLLFIGIVLTFIGYPVLMNNSWQGASYLVSFLTVYIVSQCKITENVIKYSSLVIAALGLLILTIYTRGSLLSGWNDNAMSMTGLFSFLYFSIFLILRKQKKSIFWCWNIITLIYLQLLFSTDCRSGMLFSIIAVLGIIYSASARKLLDSRRLILLLFNLPLIIGYIVIWISKTSYFGELNTWSLQEFNKTIFNGREVLWNYAITLLENSSYLGTGKFLINYHNSGIAALSVFGILGYIFWIYYFTTNLRLLRAYFSDNIVFGSAMAFVLVFLQQTVDLGFISSTPNLLPYMILGVGLGRVRFLTS